MNVKQGLIMLGCVAAMLVVAGILTAALSAIDHAYGTVVAMSAFFALMLVAAFLIGAFLR